MKFKEEVWVTLQVEGIHHWPGCPFEEVAFLRDPHRHMFHVKAYKLVTHSDRDVEFIMLKRQIQAFLIQKYGPNPLACGLGGYTPPNVCTFGAMSCEMIAKVLITEFDLTKCEVSEDLENGAIVEPVKDVEETQPVTDEKECNICGSTDPDSGCKSC